MGKEWFYWGGGGKSSSSSKKRRPPRKQSEETDGPPTAATTTTTGCMCAVLQIFDLPPLNHHHHHRSLNPISAFLPDTHFEPTAKGVEAPRNSLEVEEPPSSAGGFKPASSKYLNNVAVGIKQIKTIRGDDFSSSECSSSPGGAKTPNLVARLMGLDLLPEYNSSPSSRNSSSSNPRPETQDRARHLLDRRRYNGDNSGSVSLPETPRISLGRKSDVDRHYQHRLSLQINKDSDEFDSFSSSSSARRVAASRSRRRDDQAAAENVIRSPSYYANKIVKQVKENVNRKFGADITNSKNRKFETEVVLLKPNKPSIVICDDFSQTKQNPSSSPRFQQAKPATPKTEKPISQENHFITLPKKQPPPTPPQSCSAIRSKKEEPFVRPVSTNHENNKKGKRATPLSSELLNPNNVPTILPALKKDRRPSPPAKFPQKQAKRGSQLSSSQSQSYKQPHPTPATTAKEIRTRQGNGGAPASGNDAEFEYIQRILKRVGIEKNTSVSLAKWYSSSHPLDPSIFHYIELFHHHMDSSLRLRCNRKLIFQLVDELLVGILKSRPPRFIRHMNGSELMETLCSKIRKLPSVDCRVLEDIDALIDTDLQKSNNGYFEEEDEEEDNIVVEIERYVAETLLQETTMVVLQGVARPYMGS